MRREALVGGAVVATAAAVGERASATGIEQTSDATKDRQGAHSRDTITT